jgi:hypothetical protein
MKTLLWIGCFSLLTLQTNAAPIVMDAPQAGGDKELSWVDEKINAIIPARIGISDPYVNSLRDPMKFKKAPLLTKGGAALLAPPKLQTGISTLLPPLPKVVEEPLRLLAVMNQSALINGKWYKVGQSVRNYTLNEVKSGSVSLSGAKQQKLILFLNKQNNNIKINTK